MTDEEVAAELDAVERQLLEARDRLDKLKQLRAEKLPGRPGLDNPWPAVLERLRGMWKRRARASDGARRKPTE